MTDRKIAPWARISRRGILRAGAGGIAGAIVSNAFALDALAQGQQEDGYAFFNANDARILEAVVDRLWPPTDTPGAVAIGVPRYIDQAMISAYQHAQTQYHEGLGRIDALARSDYGGGFDGLEPEQQDEILTRLQDDDVPGFAEGDGASFFDTIHAHTMQGLFSDPIYGGNRDFEAWRQVGYPGPFYIITEEQQQSFEPLDMPVQSIVDL
ncbi:gluconate 2-dehydrogenase subunit 3 family protein [Roseicyclus sp.]|uniref:gluconate 2-dehydrogenase subunit 3 family protein n=1 Tax=Roseicyclus sp. TaxID=1914329 RepID=UPI003F9FB3CA